MIKMGLTSSMRRYDGQMLGISMIGHWENTHNWKHQSTAVSNSYQTEPTSSIIK